MTQSEKFYGFGKKQNPYQEEARRLWGNEAVNQSNEKLGSMTEEEQSHGLGQLYISDSRFTQNIDQYAEGLSAFLSKAMGYYAGSQKTS